MDWASLPETYLPDINQSNYWSEYYDRKHPDHPDSDPECVDNDIFIDRLWQINYERQQRERDRRNFADNHINDNDNDDVDIDDSYYEDEMEYLNGMMADMNIKTSISENKSSSNKPMFEELKKKVKKRKDVQAKQEYDQKILEYTQNYQNEMKLIKNEYHKQVIEINKTSEIEQAKKLKNDKDEIAKHQSNKLLGESVKEYKQKMNSIKINYDEMKEKLRDIIEHLDTTENDKHTSDTTTSSDDEYSTTDSDDDYSTTDSDTDDSSTNSDDTDASSKPKPKPKPKPKSRIYEYKYECPQCGKKYKHKGWYDKHCKQC